MVIEPTLIIFTAGKCSVGWLGFSNAFSTSTIPGCVIVIDPSCVFLEAKMLGKNYYIFRFFLAFFISVLAGYITFMIIPNAIMFK